MSTQKYAYFHPLWLFQFRLRDCKYARPGVPGEALEGEYRLLFSASGAIELKYRYAPQRTTGTFVETGFALEVPAAQTELRWLGQGPYAAYPGKDRLDEYGLFHLGREDQYFPGNRRGVELAFLANRSGAGILLAGDTLTVSLDYLEKRTIFSQVASGKEQEAGEVMSGSLTLLPLGTRWPQPLTTWFGPAGQSAQVHLRFAHSYDQ
jgi:beta-galactosidase